MNQPEINVRSLRTTWPFGRAMALLGLMAWLLGADTAVAAEPSLTKSQVESVFLLNFAKYVEWPATAFTNADAPIVIGVLGTDPFGEDLLHRVEGKTINGRTFVIKHLAADTEMRGCQILFISDSEAARMRDILNQAS